MNFKEFYKHIYFDVDKSIHSLYSAKQGDTKSRGFYVTLLVNGAVMPVTDQSLSFYAEKPDKTRVIVEAVKDDDIFRIDLPNQAFAVAGVLKCELTLRGQDGEQISSKTFKMVVDSSIQDGSIVSKDERGILDRAFELAEDIIPRLELLDVELLENVQGEIEDARHDSVDDVTYDSLADRLNQDKLEYVEQITDIKSRFQLAHFDHVKQEYVNLDQFWNSLRNGKIYTVEFNQFDVSPSPLGTKKHDNEGLICEPSTNTVRGRNDYEQIGLFMSIDVNAYVDENDDYHVTAIKGDGRFKNDGSMGDVYVMAMPGYQKRYADQNVWGISYSDAMHPGFEILDEAVKPDGTIRPFLLHAKYVAGRNPHENNNLASISGVSPEYDGMSHKVQIKMLPKIII